MVATRRKTDEHAASIRPRTYRGEGMSNDTIHVCKPVIKKKRRFPGTSMPPRAPIDRLPSSTGGMEDISLTSPSIAPSPIRDVRSVSKHNAREHSSDRTASSALGLVARSGTIKGSADNPIILEEYSPRRRSAPPPKCRRTEPEPHMFQDCHRQLYTYQLSRPALAPKPVNGSTFTGDRSNDLYRMMNAKVAAEASMPLVPYGPPPATHNAGFGIPFHLQYPLSAQFLAKPPLLQKNYPPSYAQYHDRMGVTLAGDSEEMLRKKAVQCIRDHSRPQPRRKMLSDDPDETSDSETEPSFSSSTGKSLDRQHKHAHTPSTTTRSSRFSVYQDPNDHLSPLVTQTSLLTSLLQAYPRSADQNGLREDITMLVSVQNQCLAEWNHAESRKRRRSGTDSAINVSGDDQRARKAMRRLEKIEKEEREKERDEEVRRCLSAGAGMWQDGSGIGVADVFAMAPERDVVSGQSVEAGRSGVVVTQMMSDMWRKKGVCGLSMIEC
ncbi:hypothetical protein FB567DRAFT_116441 [Paraphoma chrysanthemicola]|uniref:Uncharacterized protein n=1 Tax=Paraphoma chrysanthemicola TaxID=798071 RepID=A0A8K0R2S0_9PLEO|nr:hypothetical protein FB567DRAFT_116441 [Paraphoma chrysanthemicola]